MAEVNPRSLARSSLQISVVQLSQMASRLVLTPMVIARLGIDGLFAYLSNAEATGP